MDRITAPSVTQKVTSPPHSPTLLGCWHKCMQGNDSNGLKVGVIFVRKTFLLPSTSYFLTRMPPTFKQFLVWSMILTSSLLCCHQLPRIDHSAQRIASFLQNIQGQMYLESSIVSVTWDDSPNRSPFPADILSKRGSATLNSFVSKVMAQD